MAGVSTTYRDMRIGGLASGIDTDSIMESLMKAEQAKVARIEEKQIAIWQQEAYRKLIDGIRDFMTGYQGKGRHILRYRYRSVTTVGGSGAVTCIAGSGAQSGSRTINAVAQLATAASVSSRRMRRTDHGIGRSERRADRAFRHIVRAQAGRRAADDLLRRGLRRPK